MRSINLLQAIIFLSGLSILSCSSQSTESQTVSGYTIKGTAKGYEGATVFLSLANMEGTPDSTVIKDGKFELKGVLDTYPQVGYFEIRTEHSASKNIYLEEGTIVIDADASRSIPISIKGTPINDEYEAYYALFGEKDIRGVLLIREYYAKIEEGKDVFAEEAELDKLFTEVDSIKTAYIISGIGSMLVAFETLDNMYSFQANGLVEEVYASLKPEVKESAAGKKLKEKIDIALRTSIGEKAINIEMPNPEGEMVSLEDFRGQYVLIDFWATWCGPCIKEFPHIEELYAEYKDKGLEVLAVSLDVDGEAWRKFIQDNDVKWVNVSDLEGQNQAALDYAVEAVPAKFIIDPDGVIVAKDLYGEMLDARLAELLGE